MPAANWPYENNKLFLHDSGIASLSDGYLVGRYATADFSLQDGLANAGCVFLFLRGKTGDIDARALQAKLRAYLLEPVNGQVRFLWVENPTEPLSQWRTNSLSVTDGNNGLVISQLSDVQLRNYSLSIGAGTTVALDQEAFTLTQATGRTSGFALITGYGDHRIQRLGEVIELPMDGDLAGCLQFDFEVEKKGRKEDRFGYPDLAHLDIGFRLFMRDPDFPQSGAIADLASHRYPLIDEVSENDNGHAYYPETISFSASFDPLHPLVAERTYVSFQPLSGEFADTGLPSAYRTNRGYSVHLYPIGDESRLQFALRPARSSDEEKALAPFYLLPAGEYGAQVPRYRRDGSTELAAEANIVCGISGVEYLKVTDHASTRITFVPGQPGFAHSFVSVAALLRDLKTILESFSTDGVKLEADTTDLDIPIEDTGQNDGALGITDAGRAAILDLVRQNYFPPGYQFTEAQKEVYNNLEIVEDLINWLQKTLQAATLDTGNFDSVFSAYPETSWAYMREESGVVYYAQPDQAVLYKADASDTDFLNFLEIPSVGLPESLTRAQQTALKTATQIDALAFPMLPYGSVDPQKLSDIRQLEIALINNYRRNRIHRIGAATNFATSLKATGTTKRIGTTPQGLIATFSKTCETIEVLQLAKDTRNKIIPFVNIEESSPLKAAIQSNQLFMVMTRPGAVEPHFADNKLNAGADETNSMEIQEWGFELGPDHWKKQGTIFIFKFHDQPLIELAEDPSAWSLADELNDDKAKASRTLVRLLKEAVETVATGDPKARRKFAVLDRAARQANWTGILALNVHVPLGSLPDSLKALAAGIAPDLFYAQYVGVEVTPVTSDGVSLASQQSSLFGLIDYKNPNIPLPDPTGYNFHVPELSIVFQNSQITDFAAEVLLLMDRLFDEPASLYDSPDGRNILRLKGVAEEHNGKVTYSFGFSGANHFLLSGKVMQEVEIVKAQFVTDPLQKPEPEPLPVKGRFILWGRMRFVYQKEFDILSFGRLPGAPISLPLQPGEEPPAADYLNTSNLQIVMAFDLNQQDNQVENLAFEFNPYQMAFDMERSGARSQSLYQKFPLKLSGLRYVKDDANALSSSGFMPVNSPLGTAELGNNWYGITYELNLGSAGALAGSAGIVVSILIAWVPDKEGVYVGLKLPGSSGGKKEIVVQGLLKIAFKSIQFVVYPLDASQDLNPLASDVEREVGYLLKIKNIVLKFFVLSFPPSGQTEFILFGDPRDDVKREDKLLGWYAAYAK